MTAARGTEADRLGVTGGTAGRLRELLKTPTGISGLDEVTGGGLPRGRPTLVCGPAGCGKTLLAMEFLVRGITQFGESGVFVAFEESADDLIANFASLGFDLAAAEADGRLVIEHIKVGKGTLEESLHRVPTALSVEDPLGSPYNANPAAIERLGTK